MKQRNFIAALGASDTDALFFLWQKHHAGRMDDFYAFMTTPGVERDAFVKSAWQKYSWIGNILNTTLIAHGDN